MFLELNFCIFYVECYYSIDLPSLKAELTDDLLCPLFKSEFTNHRQKKRLEPAIQWKTIIWSTVNFKNGDLDELCT